MNLIRKLKISSLNGEALSGKNKEIVDFIQEKLSGTSRYHHESYPFSIFFKKNGEVLFEQNSNSDIIWCRYDDFWSVLEEKYNMEYEDVQGIMNYMIVQTLKIKTEYHFFHSISNYNRWNSI